jgi:hypothetical protein
MKKVKKLEQWTLSGVFLRGRRKRGVTVPIVHALPLSITMIVPNKSMLFLKDFMTTRSGCEFACGKYCRMPGELISIIILIFKDFTGFDIFVTHIFFDESSQINPITEPGKRFGH